MTWRTAEVNGSVLPFETFKRIASKILNIFFPDQRFHYFTKDFLGEDLKRKFWLETIHTQLSNALKSQIDLNYLITAAAFKSFEKLPLNYKLQSWVGWIGTRSTCGFSMWRSHSALGYPWKPCFYPLVIFKKICWQTFAFFYSSFWSFSSVITEKPIN